MATSGAGPKGSKYSDSTADNPIHDVVESVEGKVAKYRKFWNTRRAVLKDISIGNWSAEQVSDAGFMSAWRFNLFQSGIATVIAEVISWHGACFVVARNI